MSDWNPIPEAEQVAPEPSLVIRGILSYPTTVPAETVLLGNSWMRIGDIITLISTAGSGKSVGVTQAAMAWALGLPYFGIRPPKPLRILIFSGEDDGTTIGQCREGFLNNSEAITGREVESKDLAPLDDSLRIDYSRAHVGMDFHLHLDRLLTEEPADLVIINPLLSYLGGEVVANCSGWLRAGLMPVLQRHNCGALIAHHTPKFSRDGWANTDDTYSAIGGAEMANIPRAILTLRPTEDDNLFVLKVSKRQTTGWKDSNGNHTTSFYVRRTDNPERPAWIPVPHDEAAVLVAGANSDGPKKGAQQWAKKVSLADVTSQLSTGAMHRKALIENLMKLRKCSDKTAETAIKDAEKADLLSSFTEPNQRGGHELKWYCLAGHLDRYRKGQSNVSP